MDIIGRSEAESLTSIGLEGVPETFSKLCSESKKESLFTQGENMEPFEKPVSQIIQGVKETKAELYGGWEYLKIGHESNKKCHVKNIILIVKYGSINMMVGAAFLQDLDDLL